MALLRPEAVLLVAEPAPRATKAKPPKVPAQGSLFGDLSFKKRPPS